MRDYSKPGNMPVDLKQTVLIVDDEKTTRDLLKDALESCDFGVKTAEDGESALKQLQLSEVDLFVTDLVMPGKEGLETITEVRKLYPRIKILVVSGFDHYFRMALLFGADEAMSKPVTTDAICEKVVQMLGGAAASTA